MHATAPRIPAPRSNEVYHRPVRLLLASRSPRRQELLTAAGFVFDVAAIDVNEDQLPDEPPALYVERVARLKAAAGAARYPSRPVLAADTTVVVDNEMLGKPQDAAEATRMLRRLAGRTHEVFTGVALAWQGQVRTRVERTRVWMDSISDAEIDEYVRTSEPFDKAGSYAIQGWAARYIPHIEGSFANVVGLPVATVVHLLHDAGVPLRG